MFYLYKKCSKQWNLPGLLVVEIVVTVAVVQAVLVDELTNLVDVIVVVDAGFVSHGVVVSIVVADVADVVMDTRRST